MSERDGASPSPAGEPAAPGADARRVVAGIFVGGQSKRMGSRPKGLLRAPDGQTIVERWCTLFRSLAVEVVLVGRHPAYAHLTAACIDDEGEGRGPLSGLLALLRYAGGGSALAVACDMPYVSARLLRGLVFHPSAAPIVAPRTAAGWEPLFARYRAPDALPAATALAQRGQLSLQALLDELATEPWALGDADLAELRDWDHPSDIA